MLDFEFAPVPKDVMARKDLSPLDKLLIGQLLCRNIGKDYCYPSQNTLAQALGVQRQCINDRLGVLKQKGLIHTKRRRMGLEYRVDMDAIRSQSRQSKMSANGDIMEVEMSANDDIKMSANDDIIPPMMSANGDTRCPHLRTQVEEREEGNKERRETPQPPSSVPFVVAAHEAPELWPVFWECFVRAGIGLNDRDKEKALRMWLGYEYAEQRAIIQWVMNQMLTTWKDPAHTPTPANALYSQGWTRRAQPRSLPQAKPPTRSDEALEMYYEKQRRRAASS